MRNLLQFFGWLLPALALLLSGACQKSEVETLERDYGYAYYPLEVGREYIYEVDSIVFREGAAGAIADSSRTLVRERIVDTLIDNTGATRYRIERYERHSPAEPWQIKRVGTAARSDRQAFRTEDNLRFIVLVFPLRAAVTWDGNRYLPDGVFFEGSSRLVDLFKGWSYEVQSVDAPATVGDLRFDAVSTISLADSENAIEYRRATEQYARGVGLIYREWIILDTQCRFCCNGDIGAQCQGLPWQEKAENGFMLRQRVIDYN